MKRVVIGLLSAASFYVVDASADIHLSNRDLQIEETVVTASPLGKSIDAVAGGVNVLSGEALKRSVAATLGETLKNQLGVQSSAFGSGVGVPVIRGFSGKRVEVLQNGIKLADVSDTSPDHAVAAEPLLADKIEILRGPAALRYGAGAIGGVVNIIDNRIHTEVQTGIGGAAELRYDFNTDERVAVGRLDAGTDSVGLHLDGLTRDSQNTEIPGLANINDPADSTRGYIDNSDRRADTASIGLTWFGDGLSLGVSANQLDNNYGIPPGAHEHGHESVLTRIDLEQTQYQAKLIAADLTPFWRQLSIDVSANDYRHQELEMTLGQTELGTVFEQQNLAIGAELIHDQWRDWLGSWGLDYSDSDFSAVGEEAFVPSSTTKQAGLYIIEERSLGTARLELGGRFDRQQIQSLAERTDTSVNLSATILLPMFERQQLALLAAKVERAPVAQELYAKGEHVATGRYQVGEADLANESALNIELSWRYRAQYNAQINLFYTDFSRYLYDADTGLRFSHDSEAQGLDGLAACSNQLQDFDASAEEFDDALPCYQTRQQGARFYGVEAETEWLLGDSTTLRLWADHVHAALADGGNVPLIPASRLGINWDYERDTWSIGASASRHFEQNRVGSGESVAAAYTDIDAYLNYRLDGLTAFIKASNLGDSTIRDAGNILRDYAPAKGRSISVGLNYRFGSELD